MCVCVCVCVCARACVRNKIKQLSLPPCCSGETREGEGDKYGLVPARESQFETQCVLATCHSLVLLEGELVGDPLEKVAVNAIDWNLSKGVTSHF